jgi:exodeoxyribonuclease VII large subunit
VNEPTTKPEPTSPEQPWPVRTVARKIAAFVTLRDPAADVSISLTCPAVLARELTDGSRVVVHGRPYYFLNRGTLSLRVDEIRAVGIGELLARIERLRRLLANEGLFDPRRKRPLPFLPHQIGLITGRASAAEHDVLTNAQNRWPAARFTIVNVAVQGVSAVPQILQALTRLDKDPDVDVIVLARGGGSVEDLLPFSDETLCRAVAACGTPVVSAIGHEPDTPLVDHVADLRCSTPTDAGKRVVPDVTEETARIRTLRDRGRRALHGWVDRERRLLQQLRSRPVLADPLAPLTARAAEISMLRERAKRAILTTLAAEDTALTATTARLVTLGPAATLARGYAIVQRVDARHVGDGGVDGGVDGVVRTVRDAPAGTPLRVRFVDGAVAARVTEVEAENAQKGGSHADTHLSTPDPGGGD